MVDLFAVLLCRPCGIGVLFKSRVVLSQRLMAHSMSTAMRTLGGNTEMVLGRVDRAHEEGGIGGK